MVAPLMLIVCYLLTTLFGYGVHYALHQPWSGRWHRKHLVHHTLLYDPLHYQSDSYRDAGANSTFWIFAAASIPMLAIPIVLWAVGWIGGWITMGLLVEMLLIGWLHDHIHDQFHLTRSWLGWLPIFRRWNELHYTHHTDMGSNLGIFWFGWDRLFRSFKTK